MLRGPLAPGDYHYSDYHFGQNNNNGIAARFAQWATLVTGDDHDYDDDEVYSDDDYDDDDDDYFEHLQPAKASCNVHPAFP